ncbi:8097_t:CDS:2 [Acaulospora morrowiae]|uniref:8097_t:CDS:1 n=1 Tax=Acaulospora morrowiae TaxID=94023 RepID=A0A9N9AXA2_9GLOM|nr:8097_t:CDS:2 [Acaulospora morrowiae]
MAQSYIRIAVSLKKKRFSVNNINNLFGEMNHQRQGELSLSQTNMPLISNSKINQIHFYGTFPPQRNLIHNSEIQQIYFHPSMSSLPDVLSQTSTFNESAAPSQEGHKIQTLSIRQSLLFQASLHPRLMKIQRLKIPKLHLLNNMQEDLLRECLTEKLFGKLIN